MRNKLIVLIMVIASLSIAAKDHKPRRGVYHIPADQRGRVTEEKLEDVQIVEEKSFFDEVKKSGKLKPWVKWWRGCANSFTVDGMIETGMRAISGDWRKIDKMEKSGPNKKLIVSRGGKSINPVWGRMKYVKRKDGWVPETSPRCGVVFYQGDRARTVIHCGELDGIFQAFWVGKDKAMVTAYRKISPEMNAECEAKEVGQCISPVLYLVDLKGDSVWEYRGPVVTFAKCEPNDFLVKCYPFFYVQPEEEAAQAAGKRLK
jgi:hypothetical protein